MQGSMEMIKKCVVCGKEFPSERNRITCCYECSFENNRRREKERYLKSKLIKKPNVVKKKKIIKRDTMKEIEEINLMAQNAGLSYGKYVGAMNV